jgi:hypothetical protein
MEKILIPLGRTHCILFYIYLSPNYIIHLFLANGEDLNSYIKQNLLSLPIQYGILLSTQHILLAPCSHAQNAPALVNLRKCKLMRMLSNVAQVKWRKAIFFKFIYYFQIMLLTLFKIILFILTLFKLCYFLNFINFILNYFINFILKLFCLH